MKQQELLDYLKNAKRNTLWKRYTKDGQVVISENTVSTITDDYVELAYLNSKVPLLLEVDPSVRLEPGCLIRQQVKLSKRCIVMMGAVINIGAEIGEDTMIDMGAVIGARAIIKDRCHIGANAVIAGCLEPLCATPVLIEDDVLIGANATILEGITIGKGAIVGAGSVVLQDVEAYSTVVGVPAVMIHPETPGKWELTKDLR
ncbi:MAG: DapH/DapD/GlmU-related protein [Erysipelotrichaceae bacterium]|nr:DapH/DapD/GlmU-related protein [Erysipelotrichaceae bacterium]